MPRPKDARWARERSRRVVGRDARAARDLAYDREHPPLRHGGSSDCWCGQSMGHDWPGKAEGSPHPRGSTDA